jgi:hypothetical protein
MSSLSDMLMRVVTGQIVDIPGYTAERDKARPEIEPAICPIADCFIYLELFIRGGFS